MPIEAGEDGMTGRQVVGALLGILATRLGWRWLKRLAEMLMKEKKEDDRPDADSRP